MVWCTLGDILTLSWEIIDNGEDCFWHASRSSCKTLLCLEVLICVHFDETKNTIKPTLGYLAKFPPRKPVENVYVQLWEHFGRCEETCQFQIMEGCLEQRRFSRYRKAGFVFFVKPCQMNQYAIFGMHTRWSHANQGHYCRVSITSHCKLICLYKNFFMKFAYMNPYYSQSLCKCRILIKCTSYLFS